MADGSRLNRGRDGRGRRLLGNSTRNRSTSKRRLFKIVLGVLCALEPRDA